MNAMNSLGAIVLSGLGVVGFGDVARADVFPDTTPYYERDGLLDITEWFDGNDYNPTDEAWWRWDDETYRASEDSGTDLDSDWYGYSNDRRDWFYDYYDPNVYSWYHDPDHHNLFTFGSRYYDYDNDGIYDAMVSYTDWDRDGLYEDYDYYSFTDKATAKQKQQVKDQNAKGESRQQSVSGKIQQSKNVQVRGGKQHVVLGIEPESGSQAKVLIADLGPTDQLTSISPKVGDKITVNGPRAKVGEHGVILAQSFDLNGQTTQVNRDARSITGKVVSTNKVKVRGTEHQIAIVETTQKGKTHKIAVDLGPADKLTMDISKGDNLTFSGLPVKIQNKPLMMAQSVTQGDKVVAINRQPTTVRPAADR